MEGGTWLRSLEMPAFIGSVHNMRIALESGRLLSEGFPLLIPVWYFPRRQFDDARGGATIKLMQAVRS